MHIKDMRRTRLDELNEGDVFQCDNNFIYIVTQNNTIVNLRSGWERPIDHNNKHWAVTKLNVELVIKG
jgi:hypothetical protein